MRILIAPQGFKGTLTGPEAAQAIAIGLRRRFALADIVELPIADGGHGTLDAMLGAAGGNRILSRVMGPMSHPTDAEWGLLPTGTAIIEMARASGLALLSADCLDPRTATSYGTGELIKAALDAGVNRIILGLGGSATNDGGAGLMTALGVRFHDQKCQDLQMGGSALANLHHIEDNDLDPRFSNTKILAACDVTNTLLGPLGASAVYGPQKGASLETVQELDKALARYSQVMKEYSGKDFTEIPGTGAAGGLALALLTFGQTELRSGVEIIAESTGLAEKLDAADLVITGEGQIDRSTVFNKAPIGVALLAKQRKVPVAAVAGSLAPGYEDVMKHGIDFIESITNEEINISAAMREPYKLLRTATERLAKKINASL